MFMKIKTTKVIIPSEDYAMKLLIIRPENPDNKLRPGVLWMHGGGYFACSAKLALHSRARRLVEKYGITVISPEYRLSWKKPYPAALTDCHNALLYMKEHARELGIRDDQLMLGGESSGGGLTAALCMYAKDNKTVNIAYQMPVFPMIDDTNTKAFLVDTGKMPYGWKSYLRDVKGEVPEYAAPSRRKDLSGLPPAYFFTCTGDTFYDETVEFVERLKAAGVEADIDVYKGMFHIFDMMFPFLKVSKIAADNFDKHFEYAAEHYFAKQDE